MISWIPCYSLISVDIFKSFSWPPSEAAGLKRDVQNKGKKVKPLQIPPPTSSFAVCLPLWSVLLQIAEETQAQSNGKSVTELTQGKAEG